MYVKKIDYKINLIPVINKDNGTIEISFSVVLNLQMADGRKYENIGVNWIPYPVVCHPKEENFTVDELGEIDNILGGWGDDNDKGIWIPLDKLSKEIERLGVDGSFLRIESDDINTVVDLDLIITKESK